MKPAKDIAFEAHFGQFRRDGRTPYYNHVCAVVSRLNKEPQAVTDAAWLHDVIEDTNLTIEDLRREGVSQEVIDAVWLLTKKDGQTYFQYLHALRGNEIARKVKIADMLANLSDSPTPRQIRRYAQGLLELV